MLFQPKTKQELLDYLSTFNPKKYASSRNFINGQVSYLSPYLTHGVITLQECVEVILSKYTIKDAEKFLMELIRKEFFMQVQMNYGNSFTDTPVREDKTWIAKSSLLPESLLAWTTSTNRVDMSVEELHTTWRLHNHKRMRLASRCCHRAKLDWKKLADWTYYHFIDGELAPNHLSRQWVNSTFAGKAYFMNEDNLQKYRPWSVDENLRGTYDEVSARLFNPVRPSLYHTQKDSYESLTTPLDTIKKVCPNCLWDTHQIQILSPWKLDERLLDNDIHTLIVLDKQFTQLHPRSQKRLDRVQQYANQFHVKFVHWDYQQIIHDAIDKWMHVTIDRRYDPVYREACEHFMEHDEVTIIDYPWINSNNQWQPIMKFFKYWNKTTKFLKKFERQQSLFGE